MVGALATGTEGRGLKTASGGGGFFITLPVNPVGNGYQTLFRDKESEGGE